MGSEDTIGELIEDCVLSVKCNWGQGVVDTNAHRRNEDEIQYLFT
jgi:hypothetical protein